MERAAEAGVGSVAMKTASLVAALLGSVLFAACGPDNRDDGGGDSDSDIGGDSDSDSDSSDGGTDDSDGTIFPDGDDGCGDAAKLIYVIDVDYTLSSFDAMARTLTPIGPLDCPAEGGATPFSMGVDREANAWVLYNSGEVFKVNTTTLECTPTTWSTQAGLEQFGMGFSTAGAGSTTDSLYVAGGSVLSDIEDPSTLAILDTTTLQATRVGTVPGSPELTGNALGELWGFFPGNNPRVAQIDKATGNTIPAKTFTPPGLSGQPSAWAFAFYGGDYWVFLAKGTDTRSKVYQVDGTTGAIETTTQANSLIVGAGVSTCAPVVIGKQ